MWSSGSRDRRFNSEFQDTITHRPKLVEAGVFIIDALHHWPNERHMARSMPWIVREAGLLSGHDNADMQ